MFGDLAQLHALSKTQNQQLWGFNMAYEHHEQAPLFLGNSEDAAPAPTGDFSVSPDWDGYLSSDA